MPPPTPLQRAAVATDTHTLFSRSRDRRYVPPIQPPPLLFFLVTVPHLAGRAMQPGPGTSRPTALKQSQNLNSPVPFLASEMEGDAAEALGELTGPHPLSAPDTVSPSQLSSRLLKKGLQAAILSVVTHHVHSLTSSLDRSPRPSFVHSSTPARAQRPAGCWRGSCEQGGRPCPREGAYTVVSSSEPSVSLQTTSQPPYGTGRAEINTRVCVCACVYSLNVLNESQRN